MRSRILSGAFITVGVAALLMAHYFAGLERG